MEESVYYCIDHIKYVSMKSPTSEKVLVNGSWDRFEICCSYCIGVLLKKDP